MDLQGKTVLIVGAGKSGIAAGELLRKKGIAYRLYDGNKELSKEELQKNDIWKDCGIILGELPTEILADTGLAVLSPGVPTDLPVIAAIREQGIPIWGEIELAYHFAKGRLLAITGTNGKTTTTSLLGEIMQAYFEDVKVVGNIGIPYTSVAADTTDADRDSCRNFKFPVRNGRGFPSAGQCNLKHYTGSFEPSSYDGMLY